MNRMSSIDIELSQLIDAELVRPLSEEALTYMFKHALGQEAAYESLLLKRRREVHRQVAQAYEQEKAGHLEEWSALLAEHYWRGEVWDKAAEYAMQAGERAMRSYALNEALEQYTRAQQALQRFPASPNQLIDAVLGWIRPAIRLVPYAELLERLAHVERLARESDDKPRLAQILHWVTDVHFANGYTSRAAPALFETYRLTTELGEERMSLVPSFWLTFFNVDRDPRGALEQFEKVLELAHKHHDREVEAYVVATQALAHARLGQFTRSRQELQQASAIIQTNASPRQVADLNNLAGFTYLELGELERALEHTQRGAEKARQGHVLECESAGLLGVGFCRLQSGALNEAQKSFDQSVRLAEDAGSDQLRNQALAGLAVARFLSGQGDGVAGMEQALENSKAIGDDYSTAFLSQMLGEAFTLLDPARAETFLEAALGFYRRNGMRPYLARALHSSAALYEKQGRTEDARRAGNEAQALEKQLGSTGPGVAG